MFELQNSAIYKNMLSIRLRSEPSLRARRRQSLVFFILWDSDLRRNDTKSHDLFYYKALVEKFEPLKSTLLPYCFNNNILRTAKPSPQVINSYK